MNFSDIPVFSLMQEKMRYLGARQAAIAQNIANVDTPDYAPRDIKKPDFNKQLSSTMGAMQMTQTHAGHMQGKKGAQGPFKTYSPTYTYETNPNGNKVSIEEEIQKMSFNQADYQQTTLMYRKTVDMFKTAIGRTGGV